MGTRADARKRHAEQHHTHPDPAVRELIAAAEARGAEESKARLRDLTRRLGFGDNITEPQADNDTIVKWFEEQSRDANEWQESQLWRIDCYVAGHPDDEDCPEHDPILRAEARGAERVAEIVERTLGMYGFMFVTRGDHAEALRIVRETTRVLLAEHRIGTTR